MTAKRQAAGAALPRAGRSPLALGLVLGWAILLVAGYATLRAPGAMVAGNEMNVDRAVFTAINAATLSGFQQPVGVAEYKTPGQTAVAALMAAGTLLSLIVGGLAVVRIAGLPWSDAHVVRGTIGIYLIATLVGALALLDEQRGLAAALFGAASAFGNCGLALGPMPAAADWRAHAILLPLAAIGSIGVPILMDLAAALVERRRPHGYTMVSLASWAGVYLAGSAAIFLLELWTGSEGWRSSAAMASAVAIDSRSVGFGLGVVGSVTAASEWVIIVLMMIGGCPGSAAGGIRTTTLIVLGNGVRRSLRREACGRVFGIACVWVASFAGLVLATVVTLSATQPQLSAERALFLAASAAGNVGLSYDPVSLTGIGLYTLSAAMLLGRLLPLAILWWAAARATDAAAA